MFKESNSDHKKSIYVTGNRFLSQKIKSLTILVRRIYFFWISLLYQLLALREFFQKCCLSYYISLEPDFQVPCEYSALAKWIFRTGGTCPTRKMMSLMGKINNYLALINEKHGKGFLYVRISGKEEDTLA